MKIKQITEIKITKEELREILTQYLEKEGYCVLSYDIHFDYKEIKAGFGANKNPLREFDGCSITLYNNPLKNKKESVRGVL